MRCIGRIILIKSPFYARIVGQVKEPWWSGLTYIFAKDAGPLKASRVRIPPVPPTINDYHFVIFFQTCQRQWRLRQIQQSSKDP